MFNMGWLNYWFYNTIFLANFRFLKNPLKSCYFNSSSALTINKVFPVPEK